MKTLCQWKTRTCNNVISYSTQTSPYIAVILAEALTYFRKDVSNSMYRPTADLVKKVKKKL